MTASLILLILLLLCAGCIPIRMPEGANCIEVRQAWGLHEVRACRLSRPGTAEFGPIKLHVTPGRD